MPGSTNILPWDPSASNISSDASYSSDVQRINGAAVNDIFPSPTANKALFQACGFVYALATALANKGFTVNDSPQASLVTVLGNILTTADATSGLTTVPYATSIAFSATGTNGFYLVFGSGNVSSSTLTGQSLGQRLMFVIVQDGTGNRTFSWPANIPTHGTICPDASSISLQEFIVLPTGSIVPIGTMIWITAGGLLIVPPNVGIFTSITSSGNVSSSYTEVVEEVDCTGGNITRNLYSAVGRPGFRVRIKRKDAVSANTLTVQTTGGQTIDYNFTSYSSFKQYTSIIFESDGANWNIV